MKKEGKLSGIGGWLFYFILGQIFMALIIPLAVGIRVYLYGFKENLYAIIIYGIIELFLVYSLYLIFKKNRKAPIFNIISIWISIILLTAEGIVNAFKTKMQLPIGGIIYLILTLIIPILWTLYWIKSKRVKNTFTK